MTPTVVTSMSKAGYNAYGKQFLESYDEKVVWPLKVFHDGWCPPERHLGVTYYDLDAVDLEARAFAVDYRRSEVAGHYRRQPVKFSRKVFAMTNFMTVSGWLIWIDADVIFTKPLDDRFETALCPEGKAVTYLARDWAAHSETGFLAFNMQHHQTPMLLFKMRECYTKRPPEVLRLPQQHDSMVFDLCVRRSGIPKKDLNNLVPLDLKPELHVWPKTVLGEYCAHFKGPRRKEAIPDG